MAVDTRSCPDHGHRSRRKSFLSAWRRAWVMASGMKRKSKSSADPSKKSAVPSSAPAPRSIWIWKKSAFLDGQACNACRNGLRMAMDRLRAGGISLDKFPQLEISMGSEARLSDLRVVSSFPSAIARNNTNTFPNYVPGCPPPAFLMADQVREILGEPRKFGPKKDFIME